MTGLLIPTFMLLIGAVEDLRSRRIANWLNLSLLIFGFVFQFYLNGSQGLLNSGISSVVALVICAVLFSLRVFGGGDLKLLVALAAATGTYPFLYLLALSLSWGALFGLLRAIFDKKTNTVFSNIFGFLLTRKAIEEKNLSRIPFTVPMLFGWLSYWTLLSHGALL